MYTIEITFKFYSMFHSGVASLESAKNLAENYATFPGASAVVVKNDKTGKIEYTIEQKFSGEDFSTLKWKSFLYPIILT